MKQFQCFILFSIVFVHSHALAQFVDVPDSNLRTAIIDALELPRETHLTEEHMRSLTELHVRNREIYDLKGLEFAINLTILQISENPISDLRPIASLTNLKELHMWKVPDADINVLHGLKNLDYFDISRCNVQAINVVANFTKLRWLTINFNSVVDISPVANLKELRSFLAVGNKIEDIRPLSNLLNLTYLEVNANRILDHSPVDQLSLTSFIYDQTCDVAPIALAPRLENGSAPRLYSSFGVPFSNKPGLNLRGLSSPENMALHSLVFTGPGFFELRWRETSIGTTVAGKSIDEAIKLRDQHLDVNPNMIFLVDIRMRSLWLDDYDEDWPHWIKDANGNIVRAWHDPNFTVNYGLVDFTHPVIQDRIVQRALAVARCGLFDGIFFDSWNEHGVRLVDKATWPIGYVGNEAEQRARDNILARIRAATRPDFLIGVNVNITKIPRTGPMINGGHMETVFPDARDAENIEYELTNIENTLLWLDSNIRQPRINMLEARSIPTQAPFSPDNLRWVRALTTLSLTHSNGYFTINHLTPAGQWGHYWYDFWDADLGRPVGEKGQLYQDIDGLYIREFTNGWAVYNHSGEIQEITLPELVTGVASGLEGTTHTLPNLDGEMYLRVKPVNPADVNDDGVVNILDLVAVAQAFGKDGLQGDVNGDGVVNVFDLVFVAGEIGGGGAAPSAYSLDTSIISAADVERWLTDAQGLGVGDANFQRGIRFLEGLLAALTPKETTLLPNYPNPFNPETWIPYRLAREAEVMITIYDTKGTLVRRLALGNQAAGYYAERGRAAYWDGRNEDGEEVASGIYIYQFRAGDYAASRRMVIAK